MTLINALALATLAHAAAVFPESRLITPPQGALLNSWADKTAGQEWTLCYTSFTMSKASPAEFHKRCDPYKQTVSVARNSGGRGICEKANPPACNPTGYPCTDNNGDPLPCVDGYCGSRASCSLGGSDCDKIGSPCGPTNKGGFTFGGFADDQWSGSYNKGTNATFLFQLGPGKPARYGPTSALCPTSPTMCSGDLACPNLYRLNCSCCMCSNKNDCGNTIYMYAEPYLWPQWGYNGMGQADLHMGGKDVSTALGANAGCTTFFPDQPFSVPPYNKDLWGFDGPGSTYTGPVNPDGCGEGCKTICGGNGNWGETDLEVWGIMPRAVGV